ncbi:MAG TPA: hypothetical protein VKV74_13730 [Bryobacteraceae bacterium]|nr:hypothetical protein [Bryobacteraceae bacterium]
MNSSEFHAAVAEFTNRPAKPGDSWVQAPPAEPRLVVIRCDEASVDAALCRALVLAVQGVAATLELTEP